MQNILSRVNSIMGQFDSVSRNLDWDIRAESNINSRLSGISRELSAESRGISGMKNYLSSAVRQYNTVENTNKKNNLKEEVSGYNSGTQVQNNNSTTNKTEGTSTQFAGGELGITGKDGTPVYNTASKKSGYTPDWVNGIFDVVSEVGTVGSIAGSIYTVGSAFASNNKTDIAKAIVSYSKDGLSRVGTLAENAYSSSPSVKETLFGDWTIRGSITSLADKYGQASVATKSTTFGTSLMDEMIGQYDFSRATNVGSKMKVATKWAGAALSFVTSGIDNYEEYCDKKGTDKEISVGRAVTETVLEGSLDILIGSLATAGATALLGPAAPAVAVGAAAVGAVWLLNTGVEMLTARMWGEENKVNFTEAASDAIIDSFIDTANDVKQVFNVVTKWGKSLFGG